MMTVKILREMMKFFPENALVEVDGTALRINLKMIKEDTVLKLTTIDELAPQPPPSFFNWILNSDGEWILNTNLAMFRIQERPHYCDRGNWLALISVDPKHVWEVSLDSSDLWPRYYFDIDRAKAECEAWSIKREEQINRHKGKK